MLRCNICISNRHPLHLSFAATEGISGGGEGMFESKKEAPMLRYIAPVVLTLVPVAATAAPAPTVAEQDGYKFQYSTKVVGGGKVVISGKMLNPSAPFTFTVEPNGQVHGTVDMTPVEFAITGKQHDALMSEVQTDSGIAVAEAGSGSN
jgi:hypothetical protein